MLKPLYGDWSRFLQEIEAGQFEFTVQLEDIHTHIEHRLIELIGEPGRKLHTAEAVMIRLALDFRLYLRHATDGILCLLQELQKTCVALAEQHQETLFPGYTHLPTGATDCLRHHLLAYYEMFQPRQSTLDGMSHTD